MSPGNCNLYCGAADRQRGDQGIVFTAPGNTNAANRRMTIKTYEAPLKEYFRDLNAASGEKEKEVENMVLKLKLFELAVG